MPCYVFFQNDGVRVPFGRGVVGHVAESRQLVSAANVTLLPSFDPLFDTPVDGQGSSCLCVPLVDEATTRVVGVIKAISKRGSGAFTHTDEALLDAFSCEIATVLTKTSRQAVYTKVTSLAIPSSSSSIAASVCVNM